MKKRSFKTHVVAALLGTLIGNCHANATDSTTIITTHQTGEVFDGRVGPKDGIGDEQFSCCSSFFGTGYKHPYPGVVIEGQAMAYFDLPELNNIVSATFEWSLKQTQGVGAPSVTNVYAMLGDSTLSLDDFNKGTFLQSVSTSAYVKGSVLQIDLSSIAQSLSGKSIGIRLTSGDITGNTFLSMDTLGAKITVQTSAVPEPSSLALLLTGFAIFMVSRIRHT
jgi:hypothetical protein